MSLALDFFSAAHSGDLFDMHHLLKQQPWLVRVRSDGSHTPLHLAVMNGRTEMIDLLLQAGAEPSGRTHSGRTPLCLASERGILQ